HASGLALERSDDQLLIALEIESDPVEVGQRVKQQRAGVGGIGDEVVLAREQAFQLARQALVVARLVPEIVACCLMSHAYLTRAPAQMRALRRCGVRRWPA